MKSFTAIFALSICLVKISYAGINFGDSFGISPFWSWKTIESENFIVSFPNELSDFAKMATDYLEDAHRILSPKMRWKPYRKTQVLIIDNADAANGLSSAVKRFGLILYATPPDNWFPTNYYADWLKLLIVHEYTHTLNIDPTDDFMEALRWIFGDAIRPNTFWPKWMIEGLGVYMETRYTKAGRGRSAYYEMVLRAAVNEGVFNTSDFVTLSKLQGRLPNFPGGQTSYMMGYHLMNQIALDPVNQARTITADKKTEVTAADDILGIMSRRSGGRIPFFINNALSDLTDKDWHQYWTDFVESTTPRIQTQLDRLRSVPVTEVKNITQGGERAFGAKVSPDGKWLAYSNSSPDRRSGLFLLNLKTSTSKRVLDKRMGVGHSFTADSKFLLFSSMNPRNQYYTHSDLFGYHIDSETVSELSISLRAKDPSISKDGKFVVFLINKDSRTGIGIASLTTSENSIQIGKSKTIYMPKKLGRAANPVFSPGGNEIVFTLHENGTIGENIVTYNRKTGKLKTLMADTAYNRFPTYDANGTLYFVSDASGVDNVYRFTSPNHADIITNILTGVWFPTFSPTSQLYVSYFSTNGWNIARIEPRLENVTTKRISIPPPPAPLTDELSISQASILEHKIEDYSIYPSILPRTWSPILFLSEQRYYVGGNISGYDATDRHGYQALLAFDSFTKKGDWYFEYSNRQLGPTISLYSGRFTAGSSVKSDGELIFYQRRQTIGGSVSFPFKWDYSQLIPRVSFGAEKLLTFEPDKGPNASDETPYIPIIDGILTYSNVESSALSISPEGGRLARLGARLYVEPNTKTWKTLFSDSEYIRITKHAILVPSVAASWVSRFSDVRSANVNVAGRFPRLLDSVDSFSRPGFDALPIRGYPRRLFSASLAAVGSLNFRYPIIRIFDGWGTNPVFFENLYGFLFGESAYLPLGAVTGSGKASNGTVLPSAGGGLRFSFSMLTLVPILLSAEYHYGLNEVQGGGGEVVGIISASSPSF